ncbi:GDF3 factor, partial [Hylia prasina]|nr:GDF3 factor [Hylia prasina]
LCPGQPSAMWLLRGLLWALLSPVLAELGWQERSLLRSLGLSAKPSPRSPGPVPPVLWRIFQKRKELPRPDPERESCRVEEFNVPGNIVRVFADQGTAAFGALLLPPILPSFPPSLPPSFPVSRGRGSARSRIPEKSLLGEIPRHAGGDGLWLWNPGLG